MNRVRVLPRLGRACREYVEFSAHHVSLANIDHEECVIVLVKNNTTNHNAISTVTLYSWKSLVPCKSRVGVDAKYRGI